MNCECETWIKGQDQRQCHLWIENKSGMLEPHTIAETTSYGCLGLFWWAEWGMIYGWDVVA